MALPMKAEISHDECPSENAKKKILVTSVTLANKAGPL